MKEFWERERGEAVGIGSVRVRVRVEGKLGCC